MSAPPERRACPGCDSAMSPFKVDGAPVLYCLFCGGAWIDGDTLRNVAARDLAWEPFVDGGTTRRCLGCELTMDTGLLAATPVERCRLCGGTYLDQGELEELARRRVQLTASRPDAEHIRPELRFQCPGCGNEHHVNDGTATGRGMACMNCAPTFDGVSGVLAPSRGAGIFPGSGFAGSGLSVAAETSLAAAAESTPGGWVALSVLSMLFDDGDN